MSLSLPRTLAVAGVLATVAAGVFAFVGDDVFAMGRNRARVYEITVTNLTPGQVLSPPLVAVHSADQPRLFEIGSASSPGLAALAEDAATQTLTDELEASDEVDSVSVGSGPIPPGQSVTIEVEVQGRAWFSLASMLVQTNDAFVAARHAELPRRRNAPTTFRVPAYDAGSEANNEDGDFIPGPPFMSANVRDTEGAEGFVTISNGVHGIGDLDPVIHDWRNPSAQIRVVRVR